MLKPKTICIASQKGGTGKTTTTLNLAACLAELDQQVLLVDIDPQANLTTGLGFSEYNLKNTIYDVLLNPKQELKSALLKTTIPKMELVPSSLNLSRAELELGSQKGREWRLKEALEKLPKRYDFIFIDSPPSLGLFTQNAFLASQEIIVPLQVHFFAMRAFVQLQNAINLINELNPSLFISGVVCTMYDSRNNLSKVVEETIRNELKDVVFETVIPMNIALAEAPGSGKPVTQYAPVSSGAIAYRKLAKEVLDRG